MNILSMKRFLKKVGIYAAIIGIGFAIGALFVLIIIRSRNNRSGIPGIDGNINDLRDGIAEAAELNEDAQELTADAKSEIEGSLDINKQIGKEITGSSGSTDRLIEASERLAKLMERLQKRAREEGA